MPDWSPAPTSAGSENSEMPGSGFTVTETLSPVSPCELATTALVHGSVAEPPYVTDVVAEVSPVGIVTVAIAAQPGAAAVKETATPGAGAATGLPALCSRTVMVPGNPGRICSPVTVMSRLPSVVI